MPRAANPTIIDHALHELHLAGLFAEDSEYGPELTNNIIRTLMAFRSYNHTPQSAEFALDVLNKIVTWSNLTPLTTNPVEWIDRSAYFGEPTWQNARNACYFSNNGGKSWFHLDDMENPRRTRWARFKDWIYDYIRC